MEPTNRTAAIIAEYNPFHNGHAHHIALTREQTGARYVVIIMSGQYVQRGECAVADKFSRTRMALAGGADLVVELPLPFACAGAEAFARGGVGLVEALGCVDYLSFGMECESLRQLQEAADALSDGAVKPVLDAALAEGKTFAAARTEAVRRVHGDAAADLLCLPNNTLAVEYLRALRSLGSSIQPFGVPRDGVMHDAALPSGGYAAAAVLRRILRAEGACRWEELRPYLPAASFEILRRLYGEGRLPADLRRCDRAVLARLRGMTREQLSRLPDVSEGLENRLYDCVRIARSPEELIDAVKTKRYTHARIRRLVLSAFLGIRAVHSASLPYLRILGMNARGRELLSAAKPRLPLITGYRQTLRLPEEAQNVWRLECHADDLWGLMTPQVQPCGADMTERLITEG